MKPFHFTIHRELPNGLGRVGTIETTHGNIETPAFVAVGTKATVKSLTPEQIKDAGVQVVLANTYHLYLEPGDEIVKNSGGIGKMMHWNGPTMTDSGGFQAFSLGVAYEYGVGKFISANAPAAEVIDEAYDVLRTNKKARITEDGVVFQSVIDGSSRFLSPEISIQIQHNIGADIIFALDECTSPHAGNEYLQKAMERTHRWASRSLKYHKHAGISAQALFGIVQGGRDENLRRESAKVIGDMAFDGFGIGGSFVKEDMSNAVAWVNTVLPREKPKHLLGVGEPVDLFGAVENGCDLFDCVAPTRIARNGMVYTKDGRKNLLNQEFRSDLKPIDDCECYTCRNYSRAYVAHLFRAKEMLAATLASIHNLYFIAHMVDGMRETIQTGDFESYKTDFLKRYYRKGL